MKKPKLRRKVNLSDIGSFPSDVLGPPIATLLEGFHWRNCDNFEYG